MENKLEQHIASEKLFSRDDHLLVGVSGGIDSIVLCVLLQSLDFKFSVAHCNFQLRGKASDEDESFVCDFGRKLGVPVYVRRFETLGYAKQHKVSIQMSARELRYDWFRELVTKHQLNFLLTAHHLNDNLETMLLNFARGTGLTGITGIPVKKENMVRPLLIFSKEEIKEYAVQNNIHYRDDSSNYDEKYARNLIRKSVVPVLKRINPSITVTAEKNRQHFTEALAICNDYLINKINALCVDFEKEENHISIQQILNEPHANFVLHGILSKFGFNSSQIEDARNLLQSVPGKQIDAKLYFLLRDRDYLIIKRKKSDSFQDIIITDVPCRLQNPNCEFELKNANETKITKEKNCAFLDAEKIHLPLKIRKWQQGDKFYPTGMMGSKKISDFFVSIKASRIEKNSALILESDGKILWVMGKRIDRRFAAGPETKKILIVTLLSNSES